MKKIKILIISLSIISIIILIFLLTNLKNANDDLPKEFDREIEVKKQIEPNKYNKVSYNSVSDENEAILLLNSYKENALYKVEDAYNSLETNYAKNKFKDLEDYRNYVETRKSILKNVTLSSYKKTDKGSYNEYLCIDNYGNYYIFNETSIMNYKLMLDDYTIATEEFIEKYNEATEQGKVALNIDKFFKAINDKSYYFAYDLLAESFRNNYFKTQEEFENYVKNNSFEDMKVDYLSFKEESGLYKYDIKITNGEGQSIEKTIVMKLDDGTNFELSFNIN